jgi:acetylornithine/succinyldiaminopimelate/putrescine aminotransferase
MNTMRDLFLQHVGQTSSNPLGLQIDRAEGIYLIDSNGKAYIDLISGISVSNLGHGNKEIIDAVKKQCEKHMHLMVYGEYIQSPQVEFAKLLTDQLPKNLESVYFVNSGSEANEGAIKLSKRYTGKTEIIAFSRAYHGSTQGLLSLMDNAYFTQAFRPLIPNVRILQFNNETDLTQITEKTACVIIEPIQGEAGIILPETGFLHKLREKCDKTGSLLIFDEIQTGFGRTGKLFAFQKYGIVPDIMTIAKAMGGGMPVGAFISSKKIMEVLTHNPVLGHITTFGGHPVSTAAALAHLKILLNNHIVEQVDEKGDYFKNSLNHQLIKAVNGTGLFYSIELDNAELVQKFIKIALNLGLIADWFLHCDYKIRIAPPLIITEREIDKAVSIIHKALDMVNSDK